MKKKVLLLIAMVLFLAGCKTEKFYLEDELYKNSAITDLSNTEVQKLEKSKKNFMLFVYLPGCSSCEEFRTVLEEFLENEKVEIYSLSIYNEGKVVDMLDSASDKDLPYFKSATSLKEWLEEYIYLEK